MIPLQLDRIAYPGDGVSTGFPFAAVVLAQADVVVQEVVIATGASTTLALGGHYTIEGTPDSVGRYVNGITIRAAVAPADTVQWVIYQDPSVTQNVDLTDNGLLPVESQVELPLDRLTVIAQRTKSLVTRTLRQADADPENIAALPSKVTRASAFLAFDANGDPIASDGGISDSLPVSTYMETVLGSADAAAARSNLAVGCAIGSVRGLIGERNVSTTTIVDLRMQEVTLVKVNGGTLQPSEYITLRNIGGIFNSLSVNAATAGPVAGGRDQAGAFTNPTAVNIYAIYNGSTVNLIASGNTFPNPPALPSGYTHYAYLTTVLFTTAFVDARIIGKTVYVPGVLTNANATTATFVLLSSFASSSVPGVATAILGDIDLTGTSTGGGLLDTVFTLSTGSSTNPVTVQRVLNFQNGINSTAQLVRDSFRLPLWSAGFVYANTITNGTSVAATVTVRGYEVPNGDQ